MKTIGSCIITLILSASTLIYGQTRTDYFTDGDFTSSPTWDGNTSDFGIRVDDTIPNGNALPDSSFLASSSGAGKSTLLTAFGVLDEWKFSWATTNFAPSNNNYFGIILMCDRAVYGTIMYFC